MMNAYRKIGNPLNLPDVILNTEKPFNDIADSYFICQLLLMELKLKNNKISIDDIDNIKIRNIFNKPHVDSNANLIDLDFIYHK
jgi:hypothetical protein